MTDLSRLSVSDLLAMHVAIGDSLFERGVVRSANTPTGDLAEYLFCKAFNWKQAANSKAGYDAEDHDGTRFQIKGRRLHANNTSRQLSAIRDLDGHHFQILAGVLFDRSFTVKRAALIPFDVVRRRASYVAHTNSSKFILRDDIWNEPGVRDVTPDLRHAFP